MNLLPKLAYSESCNIAASGNIAAKSEHILKAAASGNIAATVM